MRLIIDDFIEILGCPSTDTKVVHLLESLQLTPPMLAKNKDEYRYLLSDIGVELVFVDESVVQNDTYMDIGDGELIFETMFLDKFHAIVLPFGITAKDNYRSVVQKIGRVEDDKYSLFNRKTWFFKNDNNLEYAFDIEFDDAYKKIEKMILSYSYGQIIRQVD